MRFAFNQRTMHAEIDGVDTTVTERMRKDEDPEKREIAMDNSGRAASANLSACAIFSFVELTRSWLHD